jgi:hypothetical protein
MSSIHDAWLAKFHARWLRPNARLYMRPDAQRFLRPDAQRFLRADWKRFVQPGFDPLFVHALLEGKANFNPNQPRVPKGNPDGGRWTDEGGEGDDGFSAGDDGALTDISDVQRRRPGIGHNEGPPLQDSPEIPEEAPPTTQEKNAYSRISARWIEKATRLGGAVGTFLTVLEAASWFDEEQRASIESYQDPPKTREELHAAVSDKSERGYHDHHIIEQSAEKGGEKYGIDNELINAPENIVRIPRWKHQDISDWYSTKRRDSKFNGLTPREYLRDKTVEERIAIGLEALREFKVLKP